MMNRFFQRFLYLVCIGLVITKCASRGSPQGGAVDIDPPVIVKSIPENFATNFKGDEIRIYFNEYVKIKNAQKQLIISPPMDVKPDIYPLGSASRYITIKIKHTLKDNTTYAFNFGESIVDNNEENPFSYFRFVFSTGDEIDSLSVKGYVTDALKRNPDAFVSVMLYEVDTAYTDSIVYKEKPRYITNTLDSVTNFSIDNIKEGTYKLVALKDENSNYLFDQKRDKIAFLEDAITIPTDSSYRLNLFKEAVNFKATRPKQNGAQQILFPFEGKTERLKIKMLENLAEDSEYRTVKDSETDTIYYWYKPKLELDSTRFVVTKENYIDTLKHRFRKLDADSLVINAVTERILEFKDDFTIEANIPLENIDTTKIKLVDKDTLQVNYKVTYDSIYNRYRFPFEKQEDQRYNITMYPEAITDFFNNKNTDTLNFAFTTKLRSDYGNMRVNLKNAKFPLIVQLVKDDGEVFREVYTTKSPIVDFTDLPPGRYDLRAIFDSNANGVFDTGNYLLGIQPERVSYAPPIDEVRASFDNFIDFTLLD